MDSWAAQDVRRAGAFARAVAINLTAGTGNASFRPDTTYKAPEQAMSRRRLMLAAASVTAVAFTGLATYQFLLPGKRVSTEKGNIRLVPLDDGSAVTLNTDSAATIAYDEGSRRVELTRGEAFFDVAKDSARPFIVSVGTVSVRAIGTSFTVRLRADTGAVDVVMREGRVEIRRKGDDAVWRLGAQQSLRSVGAAPPAVTKLSSDDLTRALAWKAGMIDLTNMTIAQASEEFARYSDRRVTFADPAIGQIRLTGLYPAQDPDGFAESVATIFDLRAKRTETGTQITR